MRVLLLFLTALCLWPVAAAAHMPLLRELAVAEGGAHLVGRMPGFGFFVEREGAPPRYVCDALLGIEPTEQDVPWLMLPDGSLLIGTRQGLRALSTGGCPRGGIGAALPTGAIRALSLAADKQLFAVVDGAPPTLHRSADGGITFEPLADLPSPLPVSGLLAGPALGHVVVLQVAATMSTLASWSSDGVTWQSQRYDGALTPLAVLDDGALLARRSVAGQRGVQIVRFASPAAAATPVLDLNYFGGFARDAVGGVLWVGDEGGVLFKSVDGGLSFVQVESARAPACLVQAQGELWGCFAGLPEQVALARYDGTRFLDAGSLADVTQLVDCEDVDVPRICAAAWQEWQADVLLAAGVVLSGEDAGLADEPDAGGPVPMPPDAGMAPADAGVVFEDAALSTANSGSKSSGGCHVARTSATTAHPLALLATLLVPLFVLARTLRRDALVCAAMEGSKAPPTEDDAALVTRAQAGDPDAFMALYDRHAPVMLAVGRRILGDESQAEDLLQDVFLEAFRAVRSYDAARATVRTWLLVRMRSRALDRLGRRGVEARAQQLLTRDAAATGAAADTTLAVREGIRLLDADVRDTLELTYYLGMTAREIATCLAIPEGTVRSRLSRGCRELARLLSEEGADDER